MAQLSVPMNTTVKTALTVVAGILCASATIPGLSVYSSFLAPIGTFILGAIHVSIPAAQPPAAKS